MRVYEDKQWEFVTLLSIVDLGGSASPKDVKDNIQRNEYIFYFDSTRTLDSIGHENELWWRNRVDFTRNKLVYTGCIDKSVWGIWTITEKGRHYLRELCSFALDIISHQETDDPDIDFFLYPNAFERAREILDVQQRERELLEDLGYGFEHLRNEERESLRKRRESYQGIVETLKKKYRSRCQIEGCGFTFEKKNGGFYSEGHHLVWVSEGGAEEDEANIVILCPNHHRMFHYASVQIGDLEDGKLPVKINGLSHFVVY